MQKVGTIYFLSRMTTIPIESYNSSLNRAQRTISKHLWKTRCKSLATGLQSNDHTITCSVGTQMANIFVVVSDLYLCTLRSKSVKILDCWIDYYVFQQIETDLRSLPFESVTYC